MQYSNLPVSLDDISELMPGRSVCTLGRKEVNRGILVQIGAYCWRLRSQGTDRLDRVPRGKEVRARVIEIYAPSEPAAIVGKVLITQSWVLLTHPCVGRVEVACLTRFRIDEAYFRLGFGCMWRFYRAVPCRRPRLMKGHIVMGATALVTYLGADRRVRVPPCTVMALCHIPSLA